MNRIPQRFTNYVSLAAIGSAFILAVQLVAGLFGYEITKDFVDEFVLAFNGVLFFLVTLGIVNNPTSGKGLKDKEEL